ncbi:hypothetical protein CGRA01v4_15051 [Colletotrichum graminicola]|nr:hypothetical protein CGRA01v4_15051 [Colletotrichum graminicola]
MQESRQSTGLADMARLAATCRRWRDIANPLLYSQSLVIDVAANTEPHRALSRKFSYGGGRVRPPRDPSKPTFSSTITPEEILSRHPPSRAMALVSGHHVTTSTDFPVPTFATPLHAAALIGQDHMIRWILERCPTLPVDSEVQLRCIFPSSNRHAGSPTRLLSL